MTEREQGATGLDQDDPEVRRGQEERLRKAWAAPTGWRYLSSVNNTEVGLWYVGSAIIFMLFGGVLALGMAVVSSPPAPRARPGSS